MKSLVVDDVEVNCRTLKAVLAPYGDCDTTNDARTTAHLFQEAWEADNPYDLICLDILMPDIDGLKLLQVLRQVEEKMGVGEDRRARILMVTGSDVAEIHDKARALGCDAVIVKPIYRDEVIQLVKDWQLDRKPADTDKGRGKDAPETD